MTSSSEMLHEHSDAHARRPWCRHRVDLLREHRPVEEHGVVANEIPLEFEDLYARNFEGIVGRRPPWRV
jgi:hypothetical protein